MIERRNALRYNCFYAVRVLLPQEQIVRGVACNMARQGLQLHTPRPLPERTRLPAVLSLTHPQTRQPAQIHLEIEAAYCLHDSDTLDFRSGVRIKSFIGDSEATFTSVLDAQTELWSGQIYTLAHHHAPSQTYHLNRKIVLYFQDDEQRIIARTHTLSQLVIVVRLDEPKPLKSKCYFQFTVILPDYQKQYSIQGTAEVFSVVLSVSGDYYTTLRFTHFEDDGEQLLHEELKQRFGLK